MFLSQMLRHWWLPLHVIWIGPYFLPSTGFRSQNVDSEYDVIWTGLRLWCLDAGLTAVLQNCVLPLVRRLYWLLLLRRLFCLDKIILSDYQIAARHFTEAKYLTEFSSRNQRNVDDLAAMDLWWHDHAIKHFPRYDCFEGTWSRKMRFSLLSKFYLNRPQIRANLFYSSGKDFNGSAIILVHETGHVLSTRQLERT